MNEVPQEEQRLLAGAERRIGRFILGLIPVTFVAAFFLSPASLAMGVAAGGGLAYGNYRWIVAVVDALGRAQSGRLRRRDYVKLLAPVVLLALLLYAIFTLSFEWFAGVVAGLLLLVPAVFLEALFQIYLAVRK